MLLGEEGIAEAEPCWPGWKALPGAEAGDALLAGMVSTPDVPEPKPAESLPTSEFDTAGACGASPCSGDLAAFGFAGMLVEPVYAAICMEGAGVLDAWLD